MNFNCNDKYIIDILINNKDCILNFFNYDLSIIVNVKVLNIDEFKEEFKSYLDKDCDNNTTGFIKDDSNTIVYLNYNDWKYTTHKNESFEEFNKVIVHEFIHLVHSNYCNRKYPSDDIWEGIAYYLANQSYSDYYINFKQLIKNKNHDEILKILKNENEEN